MAEETHGVIADAAEAPIMPTSRSCPTGARSDAAQRLRLAGNALGAIVVLLILRAYLLPNIPLLWFDRWRELFTLGPLPEVARGVGAGAIALTTLAFGAYWPMVGRSAGAFGLWLTTGVWLSLTAIVILIPWSQDATALRAAGLLLGYASGLAAARLIPRVGTYLALLVAFGALQSLIAIVYRAQGMDTFVSGTVVRAGGTFGAPSLLFVVPVFILPLAVRGALQAVSAIERSFYMLSTASLLAALILTYERSGVAAGLVACLWLLRPHTPRFGQAAGLAAALVLLFFVVHVRSNGPTNAASSARSVQGRAALMQAGVTAFRHHWFEGVGVGQLSLPVRIEVRGQPTDVTLRTPHSQPLLWLAEMGITGGLLMVSLAWFVYRALRESTSPWRHGAAASWLSVLIAGSFNTLFGIDLAGCGGVLFGSLLGITMRMGADRDRASHASAAVRAASSSSARVTPPVLDMSQV